MVGHLRYLTTIYQDVGSVLQMFRAYCNLSRSAGIRHDNQETIYVEVSICNKRCGCQGHSLLLQVLVAAEFLEVVFGTPSLVS